MKTLKIAAVVAGAVILSGCSQKAANENQNQNSGGVKNQEKEQEQEKNGIISSIKEAMGLGKTMRCTYRIKGEKEEMEVVAYVNGKKYMTEMEFAGSKQKSIFDENGMYSWSEKEKKGTKMDKACMEELAKNAPKDKGDEQNVPETPDPTGEKAFEDALDVKCEAASDVDFSVPTDINFVDQCAMMKKMMESFQNMPQAGKPDVNGVPNMPSMMP